MSAWFSPHGESAGPLRAALQGDLGGVGSGWGRKPDSVDHVHDPQSGQITFRDGDESKQLVLPPPPSERVCRWCLGLLGGRIDACFNCEENAAALDGRLQQITAVSLYAKPGRLRDWLTFYKDDGEVLADAAAGRAIGAILRHFFVANEAWLTALCVDVAVVVPSTLRPPPHPLSVLLEREAVLPVELVPGLKRTTAELGHNRPNPSAFVVSEELIGKRILLLDDVYTSGARAQSAAFALREAGSTVVALCVVGRRYNLDYSADSAAVFGEQTAQPFNWIRE